MHGRGVLSALGLSCGKAYKINIFKIQGLVNLVNLILFV
jgi:hypothetical protein